LDCKIKYVLLQKLITMRIFYSFILLFFLGANLFSQELNVPNNNYVAKKWKAFWITNPEISVFDYNVIIFRKTFELSQKPESFIISVSADNRYRLYVNGQFVCLGPQLSDPRNWRFETIDIAKYLNTGKNIIAAEVINWGEEKPYGIISLKTAFFINGFSEKEEIINTEDKTWKTFVNKAYSPKYVNWMYAIDIQGGFYAAAHGDSLNSNNYPWGWQNIDFDDSNWKLAKWIGGLILGNSSHAWILKPRSTPIQTSTNERFTKIVRNTNIVVPDGFLQGLKPLTIPANTKVSILIDQTYLTIGYPKLTVSEGKNAKITIMYSENLFNNDRTKGNRNELEGKIMIGIKDVYLSDGGLLRSFIPLYQKAFRFIQLDIETKDQPLTINDYHNIFMACPIEKKAVFDAGNNAYNQLMDICWRTVKICAQDNLMSDAYYEQMMYIGDSRNHVYTYMTLTGDTIYFRNALEQFYLSRLPDGNLKSCYPVRSTFVHPTYSLIWIDMLYDYLMLCNDKKLIRKYLPAIDQIFDWFEMHTNTNGLLGASEYPYFIDWYEEGGGGTAPLSKDGNSAVITLHYVYSLQNAAMIYEYFGNQYMAKIYRERAEKIKTNVYKLCYNKEKKIFSEDPGQTFFDQRPNFMAILTDAIPKDQQAALLERVLKDTKISQAGLYYRFYMFLAMKKVHRGDLFDLSIKPWQYFIDNGLTTTPENPLDPRSEAHPWSTAPAFAFFHVIAGIESAGFGFNEISIQPDLGSLTKLNVEYPHPKGIVKIDIQKNNMNNLTGKIILPEKLTGTFIWKEKTIKLKAGENIVNTGFSD